MRTAFAARLLGAAALCAVGLSLAAPSASAGPPVPDYPNEMPAPPAEAPPGSLFNEGAARVMLGMDGQARRVGDLITVQITESTQAEALADTNTQRESQMGGGISRLFGVAKGATDANANLGADIGLSVESSADFTGKGTTRREGMITGMVTCKVVERFPNGNLRVYGWKQVRTNRETAYLTLTGIIRPRDIQASNIVASNYVAELQLEFDGSGVVADKQGPGIGHRVVDHAWPF